MGSLEEVLEIHGFTGTRGTRPNAAPGICFHKKMFRNSQGSLKKSHIHFLENSVSENNLSLRGIVCIDFYEPWVAEGRHGFYFFSEAMHQNCWNFHGMKL